MANRKRSNKITCNKIFILNTTTYLTNTDELVKLIPIKYHRTMYPDDINPKITEVVGNFDSKKVKMKNDYSLHTEYSFGKRRFDSEIVGKYKAICEANKNGIPKLWYSKEWADQFAGFINDLTQEAIPPKLIEVHPPFSDYTDLHEFMECYKVFEEV